MSFELHCAFPYELPPAISSSNVSSSYSTTGSKCPPSFRRPNDAIDERRFFIASVSSITAMEWRPPADTLTPLQLPPPNCRRRGARTSRQYAGCSAHAVTQGSRLQPPFRTNRSTARGCHLHHHGLVHGQHICVVLPPEAAAPARHHLHANNGVSAGWR